MDRRSPVLLRESAGSVRRTAADVHSVGEGLAAPAAADALRQVVRPKSTVGTMRKVGVALIACPDPVTGVPGVALVATSYALKKKEPIGVKQLATEANRVLDELRSLRL